LSSSGLITILFTDLVGSTELASDLGDAAADELRREHLASLREAVAATGGAEVKTIGDALMVSYPGAADALAGAAASGVRRSTRRQCRFPSSSTRHLRSRSQEGALGEELGMDGKFGIVPRGRALLENVGPLTGEVT